MRLRDRSFVVIMCILALIPFFVGNLHSATLNYDPTSGTLFGASNVLVDGESYNVSFVPINNLDSYMGYGINITFTDLGSAELAAQALLDQVFINDSFAWDWIPNLTNGISSTDFGVLMTPYLRNNYGNFEVYQTWNHKVYFDGQNPVDIDLIKPDNFIFSAGAVKDPPDYAWANWSRINPVPESTTMVLLGFGLLGIVGVNRKRK